MGRVYDIRATESGGERPFPRGGTHRLVGRYGEWFRKVVRVEFDGDSDEGVASVTAYLRADGDAAAGGDSGSRDLLVRDPAGRPVLVTFRTWIRLAPKDAPLPDSPYKAHDAEEAAPVERAA